MSHQFFFGELGSAACCWPVRVLPWHGTLVCLGLILYSIGSKAIPAAELTLLSLTEVIGGIFWVWLPLFGINEIPTTNTIVGGFFLFVSLVYYSLIMRWNKRYIALN